MRDLTLTLTPVTPIKFLAIKPEELTFAVDIS
jgi:hypothetical protein